MANVNLSQRDIDYIARVVDTEVPRSIARTNPAEYQRMVGAVVDTVTNRMASGTYPTTATGVLNQPRQFSKITGPQNLSPYGSVQEAPRAPEDVRNMVADRIAGAAAGEPSLIGGALNYANPNFTSQRNLSSWVNPMIDAGAQMFGVGQNVHYHGTAPGQEPVGPYSVTAEGIPSGNIPTPTFRDQPPQAQAAYGLMATIDPATPSPVERGGLLADPRSVPGLSYPSSAPTTAYTAPASFDMDRFGPAPTTGFDVARFGPAPEQIAPEAPAAQAAFDAARFGPASPVATSMNGLRRGLLDQQLNAGILPSLEQPAYTQMAAPAPAATAYVDPMVTTATTPPASIPTVQAPVAPAAPATGIIQSPQQGLLSTPQMAAPSQAEVGALAQQVNRELSQRRMAGGILGGLVGGLTLGPVGALAGGLLGRTVAQRSYYPPAPQAPANANRGGGKGYNSLSDYGKQAYHDSAQVRDVVDNDKPGLW